jgi:hypothetical protein
LTSELHQFLLIFHAWFCGFFPQSFWERFGGRRQNTKTNTEGAGALVLFFGGHWRAGIVVFFLAGGRRSTKKIQLPGK